MEAGADVDSAGADADLAGADADSDSEVADADSEVVWTEAAHAVEADAAEDSDSDWEKDSPENDPPELAALRAGELEGAIKELGNCALESFSERLPCVAHKVEYRVTSQFELKVILPITIFPNI